MKKSDIKQRHVYSAAFREQLQVVDVKDGTVTYRTTQHGHREFKEGLRFFAARVFADVTVTPKTAAPVLAKSLEKTIAALRKWKCEWCEGRGMITAIELGVASAACDRCSATGLDAVALACLRQIGVEP